MTPGDKQPIHHCVCKRSALQKAANGIRVHLDVCVRVCVSLINLNFINWRQMSPYTVNDPPTFYPLPYSKTIFNSAHSSCSPKHILVQSPDVVSPRLVLW